MNLTGKITLGGVPYDAAPLTIWELKDCLPLLSTDARGFARVGTIVRSLVRANPGIDEAVVQNAIRETTKEEATVAVETVMRISGCVSERSDSARPKLDPVWGSVQIGNREFILGMIPTTQLQAIIDHCAPGAAAAMSPTEKLNLYVRDVHAALAPNNEDVSVEFIEHNLDIPTADRIIWNIRGQIDMCLPSGRS